MVTEKTHPDFNVQPPTGSIPAATGGQPTLPPDFLSTAFNHVLPPPGYMTQASAPEPPSDQHGSPAECPQKDEHLTVVIGRAKEHKSLADAYILWFPLGILGFHHFYLRRYEMGLVYFFTLGLGGIGWLVDAFRMPMLVKEANARIDSPRNFQPKAVHEAYMMWFPFGILGFHHYYLGNIAWGLLYTFTAGLFGIGWIVDAFRIPGLVRAANERIEREMSEPRPKHVSLCDAYALGATPLGIFGAHHFYMGRHAFGLFYLFTLGGCGIGWIVDWFRMKCLVDRVNNASNKPLGMRHKYIDDAYVLAFPLGIIGTHHFYLERPGWGVLYFFTLGLGGVGWLVDLMRMPCLVRETNRKLEEELCLINGIRDVIGAARCQVNTRGITVSQGGEPERQQGATGPESMSSWGSLGEPGFMGPPPYAAAMGGYSGFGHVYTVPAPSYMFPPQMAPGYAPGPQQFPGVHMPPPPGMNAVIPLPGQEGQNPGHENPEFKGDRE